MRKHEDKIFSEGVRHTGPPGASGGERGEDEGSMSMNREFIANDLRVLTNLLLMDENESRSESARLIRV